MPSDTSPEAQERYDALLRAHTPAARWRTIGALIAGARRMTLLGLREAHPDASDEELRVRLTVRIYGREVAERLHGQVPEDAT